MKALVLSGGTGSRLRPITYTCAKQLVPLANKPVLFYGLEAIAQAGITDVGIIVGDTASDIMAAVGDGSKLGINVTYIPQDSPGGLAQCVLIAKEFLGDDDFVMYLGDNVVLGGITAFVNEFVAQKPNAMVLLNRVEDPRQFGVAEVNPDGSLIRLVEKPQEPKSDLALVGVYIFDKNILDKLEDKKDRRVIFIHRQLTNEGSVDSSSSIEGRVVIMAGAKITGSTIRGPVVIGENVIVEDSYVGPYSSIANNSQILNSELEHSVLMDGAIVRGVTRVVDSLIGRGAICERDARQPSAYRVMIGDTSTVKIP